MFFCFFPYVIKLFCISGLLDTCYSTNIGKIMNDTYGCVVPFFDNIEYSICPPKTWKLVKSNMSTLEENTLKSCGISCFSHDVTVGFPFRRKVKVSEKEKQNKSYIYFKLYPTAQIQTTDYNYGLFSMIAEIGGYSGLFLGISVLDISRIFENYFNLLR